jgi:protein tyrosine kinase modulator
MAQTLQATLLAQVDALRRRWPLAVGGALAIAAVGTPFVLGLPNAYRASASLLVQGQLPASYLQVPLAESVDARLQTIRQEVLSRARLTDLITRLDLHPELRGKVPASAMVDQVSRDIRIDVTSTTQDNGGSSTVSFKLSYLGTEPDTVAKVTNALAQFYVDQNQAIRSQAATQSADFLKDQLEQAKKKLDQQEARVTSYSNRNAGQLPEQMNSNLAALARLNAQLQTNTNEVMVWTNKQQQLQAEIVDLRAHPAEQENDPQLQLSKLRQDLKTLLLTDTPDHPDVVEKKRQIAALESQIAAAGPSSQSADPTTSKLALLQSNLKQAEDALAKARKDGEDLQAQEKDLQARISAAPVRSTELDAVMRDYANARDAYDSIQKQYNGAELAAQAATDQGGEEFRILDPAVPPTVPAGPNRALLLAAVWGLALAVGYGGALVVDQLDTSFHSVDELRAFTHVPVLASIPRITTRGETWRRVAVSCGVAVLVAGLLVAAGTSAFRYAHGRHGISRILSRAS